MPEPFDVVEATIDVIHAAFRGKTLTAKGLVEAYLARIEALDKKGPALNSIVTINPEALAAAEALDAAFARDGSFAGPLHGIPVVVKDQVETKGLMTTFGSIAQDGYLPADDATAIKKLKAAGAVVLAKTAMPDYATSWFGMSSQVGEQKNPYALDRDPGGSSSGTAAAVAASLGTVGIGEDTGGSIRLPASFTSLVGVRVTPGLISRDGMSPLVVFQDTAGPMARTVKDAAMLLDALIGFDPRDEYTTAAVIGSPKESYVAAMDTESLAGARLGVVRNVFGDPVTLDGAAINAVVDAALAKIAAAGATLVDVEIPDVMQHIVETSLYLTHSRHDLNTFLAGRPVPMQSLEAIREAGKYDKTLDLLELVFDGPLHPEDDPDYFRKLAAREKFQRVVVGIMGRERLAALVFPALRVLPPTKKDLRDGKHPVLTYPTNTLIASQTWMPSICMPAGFTPGGLPVGVEIVVPPFRETELFRLGAGFEATVAARRPPNL